MEYLKPILLGAAGTLLALLLVFFFLLLSAKRKGCGCGCGGKCGAGPQKSGTDVIDLTNEGLMTL